MKLKSLQKMLNETRNINERAKYVLRHIKQVQTNMHIMIENLLKLDELPFDLKHTDVILMYNHAQVHDADKLEIYMLENMWYGEPQYLDLQQSHRMNNAHHPEYWGGIINMPTKYIGEMVCDCMARAQEFGTDIRAWFKNDYLPSVYLLDPAHDLKRLSVVTDKIVFFLNILSHPGWEPVRGLEHYHST